MKKNKHKKVEHRTHDPHELSSEGRSIGKWIALIVIVALIIFGGISLYNFFKFEKEIKDVAPITVEQDNLDINNPNNQPKQPGL